MDVTWSIKEKNGEKWDFILLADMAGKTLEQFFIEATGREIVAEFIINGERCYFCGNEHWLDRMKKKGRAVTFAQAIDQLRERNPGLLAEVIPGMAEAEKAFPGSILESHSQQAALPVESPAHKQAGLF